MKDVKRRLETFSLYDRAGIERHLARMAEKGWMLEKIGLLWTYRRIEPQILTFSVCYFPEASVFDPEPSEGQQTFYDFCEHTGWILAAANAQLQVFYNERENPVPIQTDPMTEVDSIHRMVKKRFLPYRFAVMAVILLYGLLMIPLWNADPIRLLADSGLLWTGIALLGLLVVCTLDVGRYFLWHARAKRAAEWGELLPGPGHAQMNRIAHLWIVASLVASLLSVPRLTAAIIGVRAVLGCAIAFLIYGGTQLLKRQKKPASTSRRFYLAGCVILSVVVMTAALWLEQEGRNRNWFGDGCATYEHGGRAYVDHQGDLPVTVEDLTDATNSGYTREREVLNSFLLTRYEMRQWPRYDVEDYAEMAQLDYTIVEVKIPALYEFCKRAALSEPDDGRFHYEPVDPAPWGGLEAYRRISQYGYKSGFLLFYPNRVVTFSFYPSAVWEPTPAQMSVVGEKLGG